MRKKYFALFGIGAILTAFLTILVTTSIHASWFSWTSNALSDLGALGTTYSGIYNAGMILTGFLGIIFGIGLTDYFENPIAQLGTTVFIIGMIFLILVGVYPSGADPHVTVSLAFFAVTTLGVFITGVGESLQGEETGGFIVIMIFILLPAALWSSQTYSGAAIPEMVGVLGFSIFTVIYALKLGTTGG